MPEITRPTIELSLLIVPSTDKARDDFTLEERIAQLDETLAAVRELTPARGMQTPSAKDSFRKKSLSPMP